MSDNKKEAFEQARDNYISILQERYGAGDTLTEDELQLLNLAEQDPEALPPSLYIQKPKPPRSEAQIEQSKKNIEKINSQRLQTGPKTPEGKRIASRNAIKLGIHSQDMMNLIRPCYSTCPEYPCALVKDGATKPGYHCLERHRFTDSLDAIHDAMTGGGNKAFDNLMTVELAANLEVIDTLRDHIMNSPLVLSIKTTKVTDKSDNVIETEQRELKANPALAPYQKLLGDMGISFKEGMITRREIARNKVETKVAESMVDKVMRLAGRAKQSMKPSAEEDES